MQLIGIDCATKPKNIGIARAELATVIRVREVRAGVTDPWERVADWVLQKPDQDVLIAVDAPLGWPRPLAEALGRHSAGARVVQSDANVLFRRTTDRYIHSKVGKHPLDVGADRIARTAHAALDGLAQLRAKCDMPIPLAWTSGQASGVSAIEVYPAATLKVHGLPFAGYKDGHGGTRARADILSRLQGFEMSDDCHACALSNADGLDAVICALAAADFVRGNAMPPDDGQIARAEGWIWCKAPDL